MRQFRAGERGGEKGESEKVSECFRFFVFFSPLPWGANCPGGREEETTTTTTTLSSLFHGHDSNCL